MRSLLLLCAAAMSAAAHARPVIYPGGSMSMTEVDGGTVMTQVDHTFTRNVAAGVYGLRKERGERYSTGVVLNYLLLRENTLGSQANAYLMGGIGRAWVRQPAGGRDATTEGWIAAEADWETRRLFFGGQARVSLVGSDTQVGYRLRAGVAPYVADMGALHTFLFLQVGRVAEPGRKTEVTPVVRLFKGPVLAEAGVSHRGRAFGTLWFYF